MVYKRFYPVFRRSANRILAGHSCVFCGLSSSKQPICSVCVIALKSDSGSCFQCSEAITTSNADQRCGVCIKSPKPYHRLIAACHYDFPVNRAISRFKFNRQLHLGKALTDLLAAKISIAYQSDYLPQMIIPIPLHHKRLAERGFNQSSLIAQQLSHCFGIPNKEQAIVRVKNTPHQIGLKAIKRRKNLKGAFKINNPLPMHVVLIDDVVTTGTTITEATNECLNHGAERVDIWCLAKT